MASLICKRSQGSGYTNPRKAMSWFALPVRSEDASLRPFREYNTIGYRLAHWPIWITVFFLAPGPLVFHLFAHGFSRYTALWLAVVIASTGIAGLCGQLPGVEPQPYIILFNEDRPNPLYRKICYTTAWGEMI